VWHRIKVRGPASHLLCLCIRLHAHSLLRAVAGLPGHVPSAAV
jgi:hypothetical protein